ncbi:MAG: hypothetical protein KJS77_10040 [Planctomycetes bacterium]|nr:hypothetical protein [Planctomycetota bacterium]
MVEPQRRGFRSVNNRTAVIGSVAVALAVAGMVLLPISGGHRAEAADIAATVSMPQDVVALPGETVTIPVRLTGISRSFTLDSFQLVIGYDAGTFGQPATSGIRLGDLTAGRSYTGLENVSVAGQYLTVLRSNVSDPVALTATASGALVTFEIPIAATAAPGMAGSLRLLASRGASATEIVTLSGAPDSVVLSPAPGSAGLDGRVSVGREIAVTSGSQTQSAAGHPTLGVAPYIKTGTGTLILDRANSGSAPFVVRQGTVVLADGGAPQDRTISLDAGGRLAVTGLIEATIGGLKAASGSLVDVGSGRVTVRSGLSSPDLVALIATGQNGGSWDGTSGIASSAAAADMSNSRPRAVGWMDNGDGSLVFAYAAPGDSNLDWNVDILDAANILASGKFDAATPATWIDGDTGYDELVDILDIADFLSTGLFDAGVYNNAAATPKHVAVVPEPSVWFTISATLVAAAGLRRRGSRRR